MTIKSPNHREKEIAAVPRSNPKIDLEQAREWIELAQVLDSIPTPPPEKPKPVKLQPIPLDFFSR